MSVDDLSSRAGIRLIPAHRGYGVSPDGCTWSRVNNARNFRTWHQLKSTKTKDGYLSVYVTDDQGIARSKLVHRLVLETFVGPCPDGMEACHNNGDPADNRLENLRWDYHPANMQDARRHGTWRPDRCAGEASPKAKLTAANVRIIRKMLAEGASHSALSKQFGVDRKTIWCIAKGRSWRFVT